MSNSLKTRPRRRLLPALLLLPLFPLAAPAQQQESYDYWRFNREVIARGMQAVFLCNGLFTSNRTLEQVFEQEIAYIRGAIGTAVGTAQGATTRWTGTGGRSPSGRRGTCRSCGPRFAKDSGA